MKTHTVIVRSPARASSFLGLVLAAIALPACATATGESDADNGANGEDVGSTSDALSAFGQSIQSRASNKCFDIPYGLSTPGAPVNQYTCHGGAAQHFVVEAVSGLPGFVRIRNTISNLCVTPTGYVGYSTPKMPLVQAACSSSSANWTREGASAVSGGTRSGFRWAYDAAYCIDVPGGAATDSLQLQAYPCNGGLNQSFEDRPVDTQPPTVTVAVYFHDAWGNLVSRFVTSTPGATNTNVTVTMPRSNDYSIFMSASDNVGLTELTHGCGKTERLYSDGSSSTSTPLFAAGTLSGAPTYHLDAFSLPGIPSSGLVSETTQYCAFAVDTSQGHASSPVLTIVRQ